MNVLITGAAGFVGSRLARRLAARGDRVTCLVREGGDASALSGVPCRLVPGDVTRPASLGAAVEGQEVVFHLAGIRRSPRREDFLRVNAEGTRAVCEALVAAGGRGRLVLAGSLAASGPSTPGRPRREEDPLAPAEPYGESKAEAEGIALSYRGRLEVAVARPPRIVGPGDRENLAFFRLVARGVRLVLGGGPRPLSLVDVEDVVDLLLVLATHPAAPGEAFFVAGPETLTLEALQDLAAGELGVRPRTLPLPPALLRALAAGADVVSSLTRRPLPLNRKLARQLLAPAWTCSGEKAARLLGFTPTRALADSVRQSARWYREQGWL